MTESGQRICSLLPSATEIVYALGLGDRLAAVTHECDFPPEAASKPHVTRSLIDAETLSSRDIDIAVRKSLDGAETIYGLDTDLLRRLDPDLVLTQELCAVCAVGPAEVTDALCSLPNPPEIVSLDPHTVDEVLNSILTVGRLTGVEDRACRVVSELRRRLDAVRTAVRDLPKPSVLTLEWTDPPFVGGHWVPEMVEIAGGRDALGMAGEPSRQVTWDEIAGSDPSVVVAMPCGFDLSRTRMEMDRSHLPDEWYALRAVQEGHVYIVDGSAYFSRPGPRLVDGVEILATILHGVAVEPHDAAWERSTNRMAPLRP